MRAIEYVQPLAWSDDGDSLLLSKRCDGPEGGGSSSYIIINGRTGEVKTFTYSSNFSPGGGSRPETISEQEAFSLLKTLEDTLKQEKFGEITIAGYKQNNLASKKPSPDDYRQPPLAVSEIGQQEMAASVFLKKGELYENKGRQLEMKKGTILLKDEQKQIVLIKEDGEEYLNDREGQILGQPGAVYNASSGKMVVFIVKEKDWYGNSIGPVFYSAGGTIKGFRQVPF